MNAPEPSDRAAAASGTPLPAQRPAWLVLLASVMAMAAFQNLGEGLEDLSGRSRVSPPAVPGEAAPPSAEHAVHLALSLAEQRAVDDLPPALWRTLILFKLGYAALMLLAVAAVTTRDRGGRAAALAAAWAGIVHHTCRLLVFAVLVRPTMLQRSAEWLPQVRAATTASLGPDAAALPVWFNDLTVLTRPLTVATFGFLFCALVLVFFGGRRGKSYYGLAAVRSVDAARTGA
jgi:hypothetical protein